MMRLCKSLFFVLLGILSLSCNSQTETRPALSETYEESSKINGITFVATRAAIDSTAMLPLQKYHSNYAAIVPYAWMKGLDLPEVYYNEEQGWWGEKPTGVITTIRLMHESNIKVMLKPQLWIGRGDYTGDIALRSEADWHKLEQTYTEYIMRFARIAAQQNVELFCIGTELDSFTKERPEYWQNLIKKVRTVYSGKITYAANWNSYQEVSFWQAVDFIGVDAYFPISDEKIPGPDRIKSSWNRWNQELERYSKQTDLKILFTEYGYISADFAGREPWKNASEDQKVNQKAQHNLLQGLYDNIWDKDWFAGGFLWKHHAEKSSRRSYQKRFTPQEKLAEKTVSDHYKSYTPNKS